MVVTGLHGGEPDPILPLSQGAANGQVWSLMHKNVLADIQKQKTLFNELSTLSFIGCFMSRKSYSAFLATVAFAALSFCNIKLESSKFDK